MSKECEAIRIHTEAVHISSLILPVSNRPTYKCQLCTFITNQTVDLEYHTVSSHVSKPVLSFDCECRPFSAKLHITQKKHVATNYTKLTCDLCSFNSSSECPLNLHKDQLKQYQLFTEQSFQRVYCGTIFSLKERLEVHIHRWHSNQTQEGKSNQDSNKQVCLTP